MNGNRVLAAVTRCLVVTFAVGAFAFGTLQAVDRAPGCEWLPPTFPGQSCLHEGHCWTVCLAYGAWNVSCDEGCCTCWL
jgi:hypothetical protein